MGHGDEEKIGQLRNAEIIQANDFTIITVPLTFGSSSAICFARSGYDAN